MDLEHAGQIQNVSKWQPVHALPPLCTLPAHKRQRWSSREPTLSAFWRSSSSFSTARSVRRASLSALFLGCLLLHFAVLLKEESRRVHHAAFDHRSTAEKPSHGTHPPAAGMPG